MREPRWVSKLALLAIHGEQLAEHGGPQGVRDDGALEAALARPRQLLAYGKPDLAALAASLAFGIARNHPFVDGNKRTSLVAAELFLEINGHRIRLDDADVVALWFSLAAGEIDEPGLAERIRAALEPAP